MTDTATLLACAAIAGIAYLTRVGGLWLMAWVPLTPRVEGFLNALAGSVLVALVVPGAVRGDAALQAAVLAAIAGMAITRRAVPSILLGVATAAAWRAVL
ncbi:MAG: AzlD domain-containing protein [Sneathiellaceae bacterium]